MSKTVSKKSNGKTTPNKGKKIYITEQAWYYENDPYDKEKIDAAKQLAKKLDFSKIAAFERQAQRESE